jgi:RNA polymerase sigma-70 factor (sigma-E family)
VGKWVSADRPKMRQPASVLKRDEGMTVDQESEPVDQERVTFEDLFIKHFPLVRSATAKIIGFGPAEDIAVEAFARAYARWGAVHSMENPQAWVIRVAVNLALDQVRRKRARSPVRTARDTQADVTERDALVRSLRRLPRRQQEVVVLRYIGDHSEEEVARTLGISVGTVKTHLHRAMPRLRSDLIGLEGGDPT